jgi:hypothetical protein
MPVLKQYRKFYGVRWQREVRPPILERAGYCCERCGKPDRVEVFTLPGGVWFDELLHVHGEVGSALCWRMPGSAALTLDPADPLRNVTPPDRRGAFLVGAPHMDLAYEVAYIDRQTGPLIEPKRITVILTVGHLNHTPGDDRPENLAAWCQFCHLIFDAEHHHRTRGARKDGSRPLLALIGAA